MLEKKVRIKLRKFLIAFLRFLSSSAFHYISCQNFSTAPKCLKHDKTMEDDYWRQECFSTQVTVKSIYPNSFSPTTFRLNLLHYSELYFIPSPHTPSAGKIWSVIDPLWESICTYHKSHHLYTTFRNKERQFVLNTFLIQLVFIVYIAGTLVLTNRNRGVTNEI